jgi:hypothetical protein
MEPKSRVAALVEDIKFKIAAFGVTKPLSIEISKRDLLMIGSGLLEDILGCEVHTPDSARDRVIRVVYEDDTLQKAGHINWKEIKSIEFRID